MEALDIVKVDCIKNYPGCDNDPWEVIKNFEVNSGNGHAFFKFEKVIISYEAVGPEAVEFHCANGGNSRDLVAAVSEALTRFSEQYSTAVTFYDNPRITELLHLQPYASQCTRIDGGHTRTFKAEFNLRSNHGMG